MKQKPTNSPTCPICGRPTHEESKYCIFHASAEEKTEKFFKKALKEYVNKVKEEYSDCNFEKFIFVGDIYFAKDFNITVFKNTNLSGATFNGYADLSGATFKGNANLSGVIFEKDANLNRATFNGYADLNGVTIEGNANLSGATFKGNASFSYNKFLSTYKFKDAGFEGNVLFNNSIFSTRNDLDLKVIGNGLVSFNHTCIENIFLELNLDKEVQIDFSDYLLRNTKIKKVQIKNHILQEKEKELKKPKKYIFS